MHAELGIRYCWTALGCVWIVGLFRLKPVKYSQPAGPRMFHLALASLGFGMLGSTAFSQRWFSEQMIPHTPAAASLGFAATLAGCALAAWARVVLGGNWSARATQKAGHELIVRGPYRMVRHPIYTGLLLASAGTAIVFGQARCLVGLGVILLALIVKMSQEERLMLHAFPREYATYRTRVKALVPGVF